MKRGYLSDYFTGAGTKTLAPVDTLHTRSNQHEVGDGNGGRALKRVLGDTPRKGDNRFSTLYIWMAGEQESIRDDGKLSWYDTRENKPRSPEWRLYYQTNDVTEAMVAGDRLFIARRPDDTILFIVTPADSAMANQLAWLFGLMDTEPDLFVSQEIADQTDADLDFPARLILDELGIEFEDPHANELDSMIERFGYKFPTTRVFSEYARLTLPSIDARDDPDAALMAWVDHEYAMFRRLEARIVGKKILRGWRAEDGSADVDAFLRYSLSVQNRRKSRVGYGFEHHLGAIFDAWELRYDKQVRTETGKTADFIFPGEPQYFDESFSVGLLTMLAAKSSCKERWSQILSEANRIEHKHLVTLEPGISVDGTDSMRKAKVELIVPKRIQDSYKPKQQGRLMSVREFVDMVMRRQTTCGSYS